MCAGVSGELWIAAQVLVSSELGVERTRNATLVDRVAKEMLAAGRAEIYRIQQVERAVHRRNFGGPTRE